MQKKYIYDSKALTIHNLKMEANTMNGMSFFLFGVGVVLFLIAKLITALQVKAARRTMNNYVTIPKRRQCMSRIEWDVNYDSIAYEDERGMAAFKSGMLVSCLQIIVILC